MTTTATTARARIETKYDNATGRRVNAARNLAQWADHVETQSATRASAYQLAAFLAGELQSAIMAETIYREALTVYLPREGTITDRDVDDWINDQPDSLARDVVHAAMTLDDDGYEKAIGEWASSGVEV